MILFGTTNQAKLHMMQGCLTPLGIKLLGLNDLNQPLPEVVETGNSPLENARIKAAAYYAAFKKPVFSCDSGLYFCGLPEDLQPGIHVRNFKGKRLSDTEMIGYYGGLAQTYGDLTAYYQNAICFVLDENTSYESMDDSLSGDKFLITSRPHKQMEAGFPLDALSVHIKSGKYYSDLKEYETLSSSMNKGFQDFFRSIITKESLKRRVNFASIL